MFRKQIYNITWLTPLYPKKTSKQCVLNSRISTKESHLQVSYKAENLPEFLICANYPNLNVFARDLSFKAVTEVKETN